MDHDLEIIPMADKRVYDDRLAHSGQVANEYVDKNAFRQYRKDLAENTRRRQQNDLRILSEYLACAGAYRSADELFNDLDAWHGMTHGHLQSFNEWQLQKGYSTGTVTVRLATLRKYCDFAHTAKVIDDAEYLLILKVKGYTGKKARNANKDREKAGIATRIGKKKARFTQITVPDARLLKHATSDEKKRSRPRKHDNLLATRDALMMCLFIEHALRVSDLVNLDIEHINVWANTLYVRREKVDREDTYELQKHTKETAKIYIKLLERTNGILFTGYKVDKRITTSAINKRVGELGILLGIEHLSPHDLRHFWTFDALQNNTPLDVIQQYGGWNTEAMVLYYAKMMTVKRGLKISE